MSDKSKLDWRHRFRKHWKIATGYLTGLAALATFVYYILEIFS